MINSHLFKEFDIQQVERLRDANVAIGRAFQNINKLKIDIESHQKEYIIAATYFRLAAAHSVLLNDFTTASNYFEMAANSYQIAKMPYGVLMEALSGTKLNDWPLQKAGESPHGIYMLIANLGIQISNFDDLSKFRLQLDAFRGTRLGVFALPFDQYLDLYDAVHNATTKQSLKSNGIKQAVFPFVQTYSHAIKRAKLDTFHWQRLAMVFHPVEPDIMGLLVLTSNALNRIHVSYQYFLKDLPISDDAMEIIIFCLENFTKRSDNYNYDEDE